MKQQAYEMKEALLTGHLSKIGTILNESWQNKKQMAQGISTPFIDEIYEQAQAAGAIGGKISGAGGGGFMIFYADNNRRYELIKKLDQLGGRLVSYQFVYEGVNTWTIDETSA